MSRYLWIPAWALTFPGKHLCALLLGGIVLVIQNTLTSISEQPRNTKVYCCIPTQFSFVDNQVEPDDDV